MSDPELLTTMNRAVGEELRRTREANGWSRDLLVKRLPSGIGPRTLLSYEHGTRHLTLRRFVEVCQAMETTAPLVLGLALQRAQLYLDRLSLWVDLWQLADDNAGKYELMVLWANNKLIEHPDGIVQVTPSAVREMATLMSVTSKDLATYLTEFTPVPGQVPDSKTDPNPADF